MAIDSKVTKTAGRQTKKRQAPKHLNKRWIAVLGIVAVLILASVLWWGFITIKNTLVSRLVDVEPAKLGVLEEVVPVEVVLVREEQSVVAPQAGLLKPVVPEGERARKGALSALITVNTIETGSGQKDQAVMAPITGIVSYKVDGIEGIATPENIEKLGVARIIDVALTNASKSKPTAADQANVQSGQPIMKIYNNLKPVLFLVDLKQNKLNSELLKKKIVYGRSAADQETISFRVLSETKGQTPQYLVLSSNTFRPEFVHNRLTELKLITNRYQGYILPKSTIVEKNGQKGIYIVYKETVNWQQVTVKGELGDQLAVGPVGTNSTALTANSLVINNPGLVQEGQPVYVR